MRWHFWGGVICCHKTRRDQVALFGIVSASGVITCSFIVHFHKAPSERLVRQLFYNMILSIKKVQVTSRFENAVVFHKMFLFSDCQKASVLEVCVLQTSAVQCGSRPSNTVGLWCMRLQQKDHNIGK